VELGSSPAGLTQVSTAIYAEAGFRLADIINTGSSFAIIEGVPV